ncbi:MAG: ATP-dependent zinc metalloprotease FtsH [Candidatus Cloacimonetes bacterium]|nr:ATP-dependent zinc metalloprotease FtsH [Candidatus Cloacimonadota bacterium]
MKTPQSITLWIILALLVILVYQVLVSSGRRVEEISFSEFMTKAEQGQLREVTFDDQNITAVDVENQSYTTHLPYRDPELVKTLNEMNITIKSQKPSRFLSVLLGWLPFLIFIGLWIFIMRSMQAGGGKVFSFGKSRARLFVGGRTNVTFKDVAGVQEAKEELEEIVDFLKAPSKFQRLGGRIPRGVLLLGRPGTGKTLLAKAVAGEAGVPFYSISGSDFVEMFVGVGASRVRDLFDQAKRSAPCIAFIDEIDAVGRHRGTGLGGGHDEREQTLNQLLVEMDGFEKNDSVIIIAATNRPDVLDPALLRPGRFDRQVIVDMPDINGRIEILKVHCKVLPLSPNVNLSVIARSTPGFSGADLANLVNEAALLAARKEKKHIEMDDFEEAKDKVTMGKERKSKAISEEEKKITAYHEIGHVLCSIFLDKTEPVHKVTIIPRGFTGGATHFLQTEKSNYSKSYLQQKLIELLGGRSAEELIFNELSTGAGMDIERATDLAKKMVCQWGMSEKVGPMTVGKDEENPFLGRNIQQRDFYSEETARLVDAEIRQLIHDAHNRSLSILKDKKELLKVMAEELLEKEILNVDDIYDLILAQVPDSDKEFVNEQYEKAKEIKIDSSSHLKTPPEKEKKAAPKKSRTKKENNTATENKTTKKVANKNPEEKKRAKKEDQDGEN